MKRITMLRSGPGSPNGLIVVQYERGVSYVVPESLAVVFERIGYARIDGDPPEPAPAVAIAPRDEPLAIAAAPQDEPVAIAPFPAAEPPAAAPAKAPAAPRPARRPRNLSGSQDRSLSAKGE